MQKYEWEKLGFNYIDTGTYLKCEYKNGRWNNIETCSDPYIGLHIAATPLHYGQACFEGMKAFTRKDGSVVMFRPLENARRLISSAKRLVMQAPSEELFMEMVEKAINANREHIPPYGTGASLYIRPFLIGTSPKIGVNPSEEYLFIVIVMPVGPYYKDGFFPVRAVVQVDYDRAAPKGVGNIKAAGNYAAGMLPAIEAKKKGYPISLYLDASTREYIDEFGTSNFFAITKDNKYITPDSGSILPSITNKSLQAIAPDFGLSVEKRQISVEELKDFREVGACGTAAVITPVYSILLDEREYTYGEPDRAGEVLTRMYNRIQAIQYGEEKDTNNWMYAVE